MFNQLILLIFLFTQLSKLFLFSSHPVQKMMKNSRRESVKKIGLL